MKQRTLFPIILVTLFCAFATSATVAHGYGEWSIAGVPLSEEEGEEALILGSAAKAFKIEIPWYATTIECKALSIPSGGLKPVGEGSATIRLAECSLSGPPFVAETCKLIEPVDLKVTISLVEHNAELYALFKPQEEGKPLATVTFKKETECPLPLSNSLSGSFVGATSETEAIEQPIEFNATTSALFSGDKLTFGIRPATLTGKASLDLWSVYKGEKWAPVVLEDSTTPGGEFRRIGKTFKEAGLSKESMTGFVGKSTLKVPGIMLTISCKEGLALGYVIQGGTVEGEMTVKGCLVAEFSKLCTVHSTAKEKETITLKATGELYLHNTKHYVFLESEEFTALSIEGGLCPFNEVNLILSGSVAVGLSTALSEATVQSTAAQENATQKLLGAQLFFGEEPAELSEGVTELKMATGPAWGAE
jgi:hypothetical protein